MKTIDAQGLSCPEPVVLTRNAVKENPEGVIVLVDAVAARENVTRFGKSQGYDVAVEDTEDGGSSPSPRRRAIPWPTRATYRPVLLALWRHALRQAAHERRLGKPHVPRAALAQQQLRHLRAVCGTCALPHARRARGSREDRGGTRGRGPALHHGLRVRGLAAVRQTTASVPQERARRLRADGP